MIKRGRSKQQTTCQTERLDGSLVNLSLFDLSSDGDFEWKTKNCVLAESNPVETNRTEYTHKEH